MDMDARNAAGYDPISRTLPPLTPSTTWRICRQRNCWGGTKLALGLFVGFGVGIDSLDSNVYSMNLVPASAPLSKQTYTGRERYTEAGIPEIHYDAADPVRLG